LAIVVGRLYIKVKCFLVTDLKTEIEKIKRDINDSRCFYIYPGREVSIKHVINLLLDHFGLEVKYFPERVEIIKKEKQT
jgi:hypothetical protein